jgi:FkbM family methyltransferase
MKRLKTFIAKCRFWIKEKYFRHSFSQYGEDILLQGFLGDKWGWNYKGFWVDIGAHHPSNLSNTKSFYLNGWRGINVDASTDAIKKFESARKRDINVNVGIGKNPGVLDYYRMSSSPMNTFSREFAEKAQKEGVNIVEVVKIPVITLCDLLDKYLPPGQHIDFISIDCEGLDLSILQSNDWSKYRPDFILIEIHSDGRNWEIPSCSVTQYMREQGYEIVGQGFVTTLYKNVL